MFTAPDEHMHIIQRERERDIDRDRDTERDTDRQRLTARDVYSAETVHRDWSGPSAG